MSNALFESLPDSARIWINAASHDLSPDEQRRLIDKVEQFIAGWASHGRKVEGRAAVVANRFVVIAAYVPGGDVSGCGIDASVHALGGVAEELGFDWASALDVFYKKDGRVHQVDRATFAVMADRGEVTRDTTVFDPSLTNLGEWRQGRFELPARSAWHARVFRFQTETV